MKNSNDLNLIEFFETDNDDTGFRHIIKKESSYFGVCFNNNNGFVMTEDKTEVNVKHNLDILLNLKDINILQTHENEEALNN